MLRVWSFAWLVVAAAAVGAVSGVQPELLAPALYAWLPFYLLWIVSDLRARGVRGASGVLQAVVSLVPVWGLLLYLLWSRRLAGLPMWVVFVAAVWIPALAAAGLAHGVAQFVRGERW